MSLLFFFFSSRRRHTRLQGDWSSDVCSSDLVKDGGKVGVGQRLVEWDPYSLSILTEVGGRAAFGDIMEGVTMKEELDEVTGLSRKVIIDHPGASYRPRISIKDEASKTAKVPGTNAVARYMLPVGAHIFVEKGQTVHPGDVLAKIPRETTKTKDITGGLPRVAERVEARKRSEEHTSELQSPCNLVCRLLLEKKKKKT